MLGGGGGGVNRNLILVPSMVMCVVEKSHRDKEEKDIGANTRIKGRKANLIILKRIGWIAIVKDPRVRVLNRSII